MVITAVEKANTLALLKCQSWASVVIHTLWILLLKGHCVQTGNVTVTVCPSVSRTNGDRLNPFSCPQAGDPPDRIRCCRYQFIPACCQERATTICAKKLGINASLPLAAFSTDPGPHFEVSANCPQPDDPDTFTQCPLPGEDNCRSEDPLEAQTREWAVKIFYGLLLLLPGLLMVLVIAMRKAVHIGKPKCPLFDRTRPCWHLCKVAKDNPSTLNNQVALQHVSSLNNSADLSQAQNTNQISFTAQHGLISNQDHRDLQSFWMNNLHENHDGQVPCHVNNGHLDEEEEHCINGDNNL